MCFSVSVSIQYHSTPQAIWASNVTYATLYLTLQAIVSENVKKGSFGGENKLNVLEQLQSSVMGQRRLQSGRAYVYIHQNKVMKALKLP